MTDDALMGGSPGRLARRMGRAAWVRSAVEAGFGTLAAVTCDGFAAEARVLGLAP